MVLFIMLMHVSMSCVGAIQDAPVFEQANKLYVQGALEQALGEYQKITNKTGAVWYNMGAVAYAQQDYAHALLYWLRAQKYGDARTYSLAHERLQELAPHVNLSEKEINDTVVYYGQLVLRTIPVYVWQLLFLLFWYLLCWCLMKKYRDLGLKSGILAILLFLMSVPIMIGYYIYKDYVLVTVDVADVYNGPNSGLYKVGSVQKNKLAKLLDVKKQWYKISHGAIIGWVERKSATKI